VEDRKGRALGVGRRRRTSLAAHAEHFVDALLADHRAAGIEIDAATSCRMSCAGALERR